MKLNKKKFQLVLLFPMQESFTACSRPGLARPFRDSRSWICMDYARILRGSRSIQLSMSSVEYRLNQCSFICRPGYDLAFFLTNPALSVLTSRSGVEDISPTISTFLFLRTPIRMLTPFSWGIEADTVLSGLALRPVTSLPQKVPASSAAFAMKLLVPCSPSARFEKSNCSR